LALRTSLHLLHVKQARGHIRKNGNITDGAIIPGGGKCLSALTARRRL
jgi:hypothetical protein